MKNKTEIPPELRHYSAAELHQIANAMDMENGKQPQLTLHSVFDKAKKHGVRFDVYPDGSSIISDSKGNLRSCKRINEAMTALRIGPVFLELPLFYRKENCTLVEHSTKGVVVEMEATGQEHFIWWDGAERVLSN